mgnify:CR=1 FL=1
MNHKEKVEYLKSYKTKLERLIFIDNQIKCVQAIKYTPNINGPKKSINAYIEEKSQIEKELKQIEMDINSVSNEKSRIVLKYRFLEFIPLNKITELMSFSYSQIYRFYEQGIDMINI